MRVMLIVNPFATATSPAGRDALAHTLGARFDLEVELTTHRGHAQELGARAAADGFDAVIVHGGDGSVNEAANGLLDPPGSSDPARNRPALGVIPGGSANVFARTLGIDPDPLLATRQIIELLEARRSRRIGLGHTDDRWFLFNTGMGMDAVVIREMEAKRRAGKRATPARYLWTTIASFLRQAGSSATFDVTIPGHDEIIGARFGFVSNTSPWTYLGPREIRTNPQTGFHTGLGVFVATSTGVLRNLPLATRLLLQAKPKAGHLFREDDIDEVRFVAEAPIDVQMDGDHIGAYTDIRFRHRRDALTVIAAEPIPEASR